jgi:hypothetical protein
VRCSISPWGPFLACRSFAVLAGIHANRLQRFERAKAAERVYLRGVDRLGDRWAGTGRDGASFLTDHPYAGDLDLFGPASLFELLNTMRTEIGELTLADWLRGPAPLAEVRSRQGAVDELRPMLDFKEDVAVLASESPVGRTGPLAAWAASPAIGFAPALRAGLFLCAVITVALVAVVQRDRRSGMALCMAVRRGGHCRGMAALVSRGAARHRHARTRSWTPCGRPGAHRVGTLHVTASDKLHEALMTAGVPPSRRIARFDGSCRGSTRRTT